MKNRIFLLLLMCTILLAMVSGVGAQGTDCLNLPEADCAVIQAADANSENINSFQMNFALDFTLGGLESVSPEAAGGVELHVSGQGPFVGLSDPDSSAMMSGDFSSLLNAFNMQMDINASMVAPDENQSGSVSIVIVDGILYFQDPDSGQWMGMTGDSIASQFAQFGSMMGGAGSTDGAPDPSAIMSQIPPELMAAFSSIDFEALAATPGFLNYQRLPDEDLFGQPASPFQFSADFGTLFKSPDFQASLTQILQAASQMNTGADPQEAQQAQMMAMMIPMVVSNTTGRLNITQWVGTTDQFIHKFALDLEGAVDLSALMGASGGDAAPSGPITIDLHFEVGIDQINGTFDITAPEGATIITPEMMGS